MTTSATVARCAECRAESRPVADGTHVIEHTETCSWGPLQPTFATFLDGLLSADGRPFELEPWQRAFLERLERGESLLNRSELELAERRYGRRERAAAALAAAALGGHDLVIASNDKRTARAIYDRAAELLDAYGQARDLDVTLAVRRLERAPRSPRSETPVVPRQTNDPRHAGGSKCSTPPTTPPERAG
jgi:hypothetical protein